MNTKARKKHTVGVLFSTKFAAARQVKWLRRENAPMVREISAYADVKRQISFHREYKLSILQFVLNKLLHIERYARYFTVIFYFGE